MAEDHSHCDHHEPASASKLGWAIGLTTAFVIVELIAGLFGHSLALMSDAGHNFADAAALGFSWYAVWMARRPANSGMTFGYHRVGILAALVNAISLVLIAIVITIEAITRLHHPQAVHGWLMVAVAAMAIGLNVLISLWLHAGAKHDLNLRAAYLHMMGDAISAAGVVVAGVIVATTGWQLADPLISFLIAGLILVSSWGVLSESVNVLLEATPRKIDMTEVIQTIRNVGGVNDVHDLHVWTVGPGVVACSCHLLVSEQTVREGQTILARVVQELENRHRINHATVQMEVECRETREMYCRMNGDSHIGHAH